MPSQEEQERIYSEINVDTILQGLNEQEAESPSEAEDVEDQIEIRKPIECSLKHITIKRIIKMMKERKIQDFEYQRNLIWTIQQKSDLITSIITDIPIPQVFMWDKNGDNTLFILDGKQRLFTIFAFLNNEFRLYKNLKPVLGIDIANKTFSELPDDFQDFIMGYTVETQVINRGDEEVITTIFQRLNAGTPLAKIEILKTEMNDEILEFLNITKNHPFFERTANFTALDRKKMEVEMTILKTLMIYEGETDLSYRKVKEFILRLNETGIPEWEKDRLAIFLQRLSEAAEYLCEEHRKLIFKKINIPMIASLVDESPTPNLTEDLAEWIENRSEDYINACKGNTTCTKNVTTRLVEIQRFFREKNYDIL